MLSEKSKSVKLKAVELRLDTNRSKRLLVFADNNIIQQSDKEKKTKNQESKDQRNTQQPQNQRIQNRRKKQKQHGVSKRSVANDILLLC